MSLDNNPAYIRFKTEAARIQANTEMSDDEKQYAIQKAWETYNDTTRKINKGEN